MKTSTLTTMGRPRRLPRWFRFPWQPRSNRVDFAPPSLRLIRESSNKGNKTPSASDQAQYRSKSRQRIADVRLSEWLEMQFRPLIAKANRLTRDTLALALHFLTIAPVPERINSRALLLSLIREYPELDEKGAQFIFAIRPNKTTRSPDDLDEETAQRLGFARYLTQLGVYNEGFADTEAPPQYRSPFSDEDLKRKDV